MNLIIKKVVEKSLLSMSSDTDFIYGIHNIRIENKDFQFRYNELSPLHEAEKT